MSMLRTLLVCLAVALPLPAIAGVLTGQWPGRAGECELRLEEYDREVLQLRMRHAGATMWDTCTPAAADLAPALEGLLQAARADRAAPFSLFLGRVVELPRLSRQLVEAARESKEWDAATGRPRTIDVNRFVAELLLNSVPLRDLFPGYDITRISVEKVLVPTRAAIRERKEGGEIPDARLPYDALLWVRLERRR
jgi:hypothetical protein